MSKGNVMTNNTASVNGSGELVLCDVIWFTAQKLIDRNISAKAKRLPLYSIIRHFVVFSVKVMLWQLESYKSDGQSAYETNIFQPSKMKAFEMDLKADASSGN